MHVISMQSSVVWDILRKDRVYYASADLVREKNDYTIDIERLNGRIPIWCYYWPDLSFYTMYDGDVLDYIRMEMSLERPNCWDSFLMFELEVPDNELLIGHTCNASAYSKIFPVLRLEMVRAVYSLKDANPNNPFWKVITPVWISPEYAADVITTVTLNCEEVTELSETSHEGFSNGPIGKCLSCAKKVHYVKDNKHFCTLACMWEHYRKFLRVSSKENIPMQDALQLYTRAVDEDFKHGIVKAVRKLRQNSESGYYVSKEREDMSMSKLNKTIALTSEEETRKYRVVTFQSKEVVDTLLRNEVYLADLSKAREGSICQEDIANCSGKIPIWVFQHPAFCFDKVGNHQFCNMLETFRCEMSIPSLNDLYMIELHLNYQPPIGKAHNGSSLACVIPSVNLKDVAGIYKLNQTEFFFYDIIPYKLYSSNCLFDGIHSFNKDTYKNDKLPELRLSKFKNEKEYYDYNKVLYAYVLDIISNKRLDLLIDEIVALLPKQVLSLEELYREVNSIINQSSSESTVSGTTVVQKRATLTPDENPFDYNPESHMLTILGKTDAKIRIGIAGMVDFMHSIKPLLENRYRPYSGNDINNTLEALRDRLIKENYVKLPGPGNCEVWGCFNDDIENLLMLEIIYPYTGSRHINVAIDLSKF